MGDLDRTTKDLQEELERLRLRVSELENSRGSASSSGEPLRSTLQSAMKREAEFQGLLDASRAVLGHRNFEDAARAIFSSCKSLTGATAGYVALLNQDGTENNLLFLDAGGLPCSVDPGIPMPIRGLRRESYETGRVVYENDFAGSEWARFLPQGHARLENVLFAPLNVDGVAKGIIGLANKPGGFGDDDSRVAGAFGEMAAVALLNSLNIERLEQSRERFRAVAQSARDAIISCDSRGRIVFWSRGAEEMFGHPALDTLGKPLTMVVPENFRDIHIKALEAAVTTGTTKVIGKTLEVDAMRAGGEVFPAELSLARWKTDEGVFFTAIIRDVTERKAAEAALRRAHDKLEQQVTLRTAALLETTGELEAEIEEHRRTEKALTNILESVEEGLIVVDPEYRILSANRAYCNLVGKPPAEVAGGYCYKLLTGKDRPCHEDGEACAVRITYETGEPSSVMRTNYYRGRGAAFLETKAYPMKDETGSILSVIQIIHDVTEKRKLEAELMHSQKMKAVGQLAGGIAHDFNNRLAAIINCCYILKMKMASDDPLRANVDQILASSERASSLTKSLLTFSRKQMINLKPLRLNDVISGAGKLIKQVTGAEIEWRMSLSERDLVVMADGSQLEHVLLNLATNARDAISGPGLITVSTSRVYLGEEFIRHRSFGKAGPHALITFSDNGCGMSGETLGKVFEPFFTTKDIGEGTGLGLSMVYGIIKQHGGFISVLSEPGSGTTFHIYLPLFELRVKKPKAEALAEPAGGSETVMIAEDEEDVRRPLSQMLQSFGYEVVEAVDGEDAVERFIQGNERIGLLILDLMLPRLSGSDAFKRIKAIKPDIKAIFTSGYAADYIERKGLMESGATFLSKPVAPDVLLRTIREVLDA